MFDEGKLRKAAEKGDINRVKELIKGGVNVNAADGGGLTALTVASFKGYPEIVRILIENGALVDAKEKDGSTALMEAIVEERTETVKILLEAKADVNIVDKYGKTALDYSIQDCSNPEIIEMLKKAGAEETKHITTDFFSVSVNRSIKNVRPWVRHFGRIFDLLLFQFVIINILSIVAPRAVGSISKITGGEFLVIVLFLFFWVFFETFFLSTWGTTLGKWLLSTSLRNSAGEKLTFSQALNRSFSVSLNGLAFGIPIVSIFTLVGSYNDLVGKGSTKWDSEGGFVVSHGKANFWKILILVLFLVIVPILSVMKMQYPQ